jgi:hypothetical protein
MQGQSMVLRVTNSAREDSRKDLRMGKHLSNEQGTCPINIPAWGLTLCFSTQICAHTADAQKCAMIGLTSLQSLPMCTQRILQLE